MKATFKGVPGEKHDSIYMYGQNFPLNEAVEVNDPRAARKLASHPHFETDGDVPVLDDANVRTYVNTVMEAGLTTLQRTATQAAQQTAPESPPAPPATATPKPARSATEYQAMEMSGRAPEIPKTAEQLRAELEQAEQAEKETTDGDRDAAGDADSSTDQSRRASADAQRGRTGKRG